MEPHEYRWILQEARFLCLTPSLRLGKLQRTKSQFRIAGLFLLPSREQVLLLKPRANERNIVGCYMLRPPCCMLLAVVACCCAKFETGQTFQPTTPNISFVPWSPKRSATMLDPFAQLFQHCWGHARSLRMVYKDFWVVSFPRCTAGSNIVGSCCIRLHTTANKHATTPNIAGATTLGVVAPVCTQP